MTKRKIIIGAFVGGKGFKCAAFDLMTKSIIEGSVVEGRVDKDAGNRHIIPLWSMKIKNSIKSINENELLGIGFSIPGPFDYKNGIGDYRGVPKYEQLNGCNITQELLKRLMLNKPVEIRYINDAIGFALGQEWLSTINSKKGISIILDTGLGSAFLVDQLPVLNGDGVPSQGAAYRIPFLDGIAEDYFSIRGLLREFSNQETPDSSVFQNKIQKVNKSDEDLIVFKNFGHRLGEFLIPTLKKFRPEYISFGGVIGSQLAFFKESLNDILLAENLNIKLQLPEVGDDAFMYGGARLFDEKYWSRIKPLLNQMD
ncbi:MAG: ROK family protein [Reichenbachiella sp.]